MVFDWWITKCNEYARIVVGISESEFREKYLYKYDCYDCDYKIYEILPSNNPQFKEMFVLKDEPGLFLNQVMDGTTLSIYLKDGIVEFITISNRLYYSSRDHLSELSEDYT